MSSARRPRTTYKEKTILNLLHVYTSPNHGSNVLRYWPVTHVTHSHLSTHLTHDPLTHNPLTHCVLCDQWTYKSHQLTSHCKLNTSFRLLHFARRFWNQVFTCKCQRTSCEQSRYRKFISGDVFSHLPFLSFIFSPFLLLPLFPPARSGASNPANKFWVAMLSSCSDGENDNAATRRVLWAQIHQNVFETETRPPRPQMHFRCIYSPVNASVVYFC